MGAEFSCQVAHSEHGLHFETEVLEDPSQSLPTNGIYLVVEFNGVAIVQTSGSVAGFMDYQAISGWAHSESNHRISFQVTGASGASHKFVFRVNDAATIEQAIMARIDVFLDDNKFNAIPLNDPSGRDLLPTEECTLTINHQGITVEDPSGEKGNVGFLFTRMESWGEGAGGSVFSIRMPQGVFQFSTDQAATIVHKLSEVANMILHAEHGHPGSHSSGAPASTGQVWKVEMVVDPIGVGLPENCLLKVTSDMVKIMGRGTKDSLDIRLTSLQQWGMSQGTRLSLTLVPDKGSKVFVLDCRTPETVQLILATLQSTAEALAEKQKNHSNGIPPPPATHPPREAHHVESDTMRQIKITIPKGVKPGNFITINDPSAGKIKIKVPKGMKPGNIMTVNIKKKSPDKINHDDHGITPHHDHAAPPPHHELEELPDKAMSLSITIPKGVKAGNKITINLPDGRKLVVTVPKGMKAGNTMKVNYKTKAKPPPPASTSSAPPPPPSTRPQYVMVTVPPGSGPGSKLKASFQGHEFIITVPEGASVGQKLKVQVPVTPSMPRAADAPPPPPPPMLAPQHTLSQWPDRTIRKVKEIIVADISTADVLELLDMADGDINRAVNMYLNRDANRQDNITHRRRIQSVQIPIAQPIPQQSITIPIAQPVVPSTSSAAPPAPSSSSGMEKVKSTKAANEFKARSYAANEDFGFPENVTLSLARGHFTVLDDEGDDLASWPMAHVHDWAATGKHDIEVHVPEGTLEFGIENPEGLLSKLSVIHAALSGE